MLKVEITRINTSTGKTERINDFVAEEKPLYVFLNRSQYATIFCTPSQMKELAVGHALSEGIIKSVNEVKEVRLQEKKRVCHIILKESVDLEERLRLAKHFARVIFTACGSDMPYQPSTPLAKIKSNLHVKAEDVLKNVNSLNSDATIFRKTGGVHAAAIFNTMGTRVAFAEDVGRHNAVDKTVGAASLAKAELNNCLLVLTGRLTADIIVKAARARIPLVASLAAALDSGIALAKDLDLTLVGFARGKRLNVYSFPERILA